MMCSDLSVRVRFKNFDAGERFAFHPFEESSASCRNKGEIVEDIGQRKGCDCIPAACNGGERAAAAELSGIFGTFDG